MRHQEAPELGARHMMHRASTTQAAVSLGRPEHGKGGWCGLIRLGGELLVWLGGRGTTRQAWIDMARRATQAWLVKAQHGAEAQGRHGTASQGSARQARHGEARQRVALQAWHPMAWRNVASLLTAGSARAGLDWQRTAPSGNAGSARRGIA
jgi:hypothetical protein